MKPWILPVLLGALILGLSSSLVAGSSVQLVGAGLIGTLSLARPSPHPLWLRSYGERARSFDHQHCPRSVDLVNQAKSGCLMMPEPHNEFPGEVR